MCRCFELFWDITEQFVDTYRQEFFKADLVVLVFVSIFHQFLDDLSDFVPWQGQIGLFEQLVELMVTNKAIAIQIYGEKLKLLVWCNILPLPNKHKTLRLQLVNVAIKLRKNIKKPQQHWKKKWGHAIEIVWLAKIINSKLQLWEKLYFPAYACKIKCFGNVKTSLE